MARNTARSILQRQLDARRKLWPDLADNMLWSMDKDGWVAVPRLMPLMLSIMDDLSGKGFPVGKTYLELWSRQRIEESFVTLNRPEEMAFHAGFEGQRATRTWKDRIQRLSELGFIGLKPGPLGDLSYALIYNPYHIIKRAYLSGLVQENKWQALVIRANEVSAFDIDDLDESGNLIPIEAEDSAEAGKSTGGNIITAKSRSAGSAKAVKTRPPRRSRGGN
ncbi:hypothetical protein OSH11_24425 [Kaistia dalseonensis]|uniref:Uncharacterized protein n=1 Tax=Kaistia dalseonensis TaxID=410840 RepID=A0ABU0HDW1_9HYPH|nr:hypothetical protein [Kaistia dalseonensis]MCX5497867.1 hypothetical protein [Kaistia dalseonensis]MDQ0440511.1 hypothetical protein [Kaistia dalseonensis]